MTAKDLTARLQKARKTSTGWTALCPAHADKNASLSISESEDGTVLLKCHAGCTLHQICAALGIKIKDLFPAHLNSHKRDRAHIVRQYGYTDAEGKLLYEVVRFDPKDFRQRRPDGKGGWTWNLNGITRVLYRLPAVLKAKANKRAVFVAEGEKDVEALESIGLTATCNPGGAGKWQDSYTDTLAGATVFILPDKDTAGRKHAALVLKSLTGKAHSVRVVELPDRNGNNVNDPADWVRAGGAREELRQVVQDAPKWSPPRDKEAAIDRRAVTSPDNGQRGGRPPSPPAAQTAAGFAADKLTMPDGHLVARHYRDAWYRFADGWHPITDGEMEKTVMTYLQDREDLAKFASPHYARSVLHNLASFNLCGIEATVEKPCWLASGEDARNWIAFSNGIAVNVWSYAEQLAAKETPRHYTRPVTPDLFSGDFVSYPWDETAFPELFFNYLEHVQPDTDSFNAVRRMMGLLLADTGKYEVFWQLYGSGANGKTVLLDVIEALVGRRNICRVALESLAPGTRFQSFPLATAKVNLSGELATDLGRTAYAAIEGQLKHAVSGGTIEIERKGQDKTEERCRARFVMAGNSLPTFFDKSDAIWRRLRIIPFTVQIPEEERDPDLAAKIIATELPGVCLWALDGLAEVIRAGRVEECKAGLAKKKEHRAACDHERTFLTEDYEAGSDSDRIRSGDLYGEYRTWMDVHGYRPCGAAKFASRVRDVFPGCTKKSMRIDGDTVNGFAGIRKRDVVDVVTSHTAIWKPNSDDDLGSHGGSSEPATSTTWETGFAVNGQMA